MSFTVGGRTKARQDTAGNSIEGSKLWAGATELGIVVTRDFLAVLKSVEFAQSPDSATPFSGTMLHFTSEHIDVYASNGTCLAINRVLPKTVASIESAVTVPATFVSEITEHFSSAAELRLAMNAHGEEHVLLVSANGPETLVQPLWNNDSHLGVVEAVRVEEGSALIAVATLPLGSRVRKIPPTGSVTLALAPGKLIMRAGNGMIDNPIEASLQGNPQQVLMDAAHLRSGYEFVRQSHSERYTHVQFQTYQSYGNMYGVSLTSDGETVFGRSDFFFAIGPAGTPIHSAPGSTAKKPGDAWLNAPAQPEDVDAILRELDDIIGQPELKEQVRTLLSQVRMSKIKEAKGLKGGQSAIHMVFTGPPGTGKTTVARIIARLYFALGVLKNDTVTEVERSDLVSSNVGGTEENTAQAIEDAMGGVLFIDEAYQLVGEGNDFGKRAIDAILKALEDRRGEFVCIAAGYTDEMRDFIDSNPGMKSRFTKTINFSTYSSQELVAIAEVMAKHGDNIIAPESAETLEARLSVVERQGLFETKDWGNARSMRNLLEAAAAFRDVRLSQDPALDFDDEVALMTISQDDMVRACDAAQIGGHTAGSETPEDVLAELDRQIGQPGIKHRVAGILASVRAGQERAKAGVGEHNTLIEHFVFTGPPGTGKTTIARLIARLYRALGLLGSDRVVEVDQSDLVAGYVGQTALQTTRKIDEAMGGVLFVDEAYSLVGQGGNSFGGEAIDTLLKRMEDDRGRFMVIAAGYPDQMETFVKSNPGLHSRFTKTIDFQPYSPDELTQIAELMAKSGGALLDDSAVEALRGRLERAHRDGEFDTKEWGNARTARNLVDEASRVRDLRLFADADAVHTAEVMVTITGEDIETACATQRVGQAGRSRVS